jgi:hypothetical protein
MNKLLSFVVIVAPTLILSCGKNTYLGLITDNSKGGADSKVEVAALDVYHRYYPGDTKSAGLSITSLYPLADSCAFVIDFEDAGFVILENNPFFTPLVITEAGSYDGVQVNMAREMINSMIRQIPGFDFPDDTIIQSRYMVDSLVVAPLTLTKWHQKNPFNKFTPNGYAGCGPIAVAQAMSVFSFPNSLSLTYAGADVTVTQLDWPNMVEAIHGKPNSPFHQSDTCSYCVQLGRLARQIGEVLESRYNNGGTGTDVADISLNILQLGYSVEGGNYQIDSVVNSITRGYPVLLTGTSVYNGGGHLFDILGSMIVNEIYQIKVRENGVWTSTQNYHNIYTYLYCNFGEIFGIWNGWYLAHKKSKIVSNGVDLGWTTQVNTLSDAPYTSSAYMLYNFHPLDN